MGKIIFRITTITLAIVLLIASIIILSWSCTAQKIYHGETYLEPHGEYTIVTHKDAKVSFSEGNFTVTELDPSAATSPYKIDLFDGYLSHDEKKFYLISGDVRGTCQVSVHYDKGLSDKIHVYDLVFYSPIDDVSRLRFIEYTLDDFQEVNRSDKWQDGLRVFDTVTLTFGGAYEMIDWSSGLRLDGSSTVSFDTVHFEAYNESGSKQDASVAFDSEGNLVVVGTQSGYFKYYSEVSGGFIVPYVVIYEGSPVIDMIISSYQRAYGKALSPSEITSGVINSLSILETDSFPTFLSEAMFNSIFPNVSMLNINLTSDMETNTKCFIPEALQKLQIINLESYPISANVSFFGEGGSASVGLIGNVALNGNGSDPTFSGFNELEITVNSVFFGDRAYISSQNATAESPNALDVFNNIETLKINVEETFLDICAGNGAGNIRDLASGNGGTAIDCKRVEITHTGSVSIYGGDGGVGFKGDNGADGYKEGDYYHFYHGTNGGNGGEGGAAIKAQQAVFRSDYYSSITLKGGRGGNGGRGGDGGKGYVGKSYIFGIREEDGNGGNGGNGGSGGNGNYALFVTEFLDNYTKLNVLDSGKGNKGGVGSGGESRDRPGSPGTDPGTDGESFTWQVVSGTVNGNEPITN